MKLKSNYFLISVLMFTCLGFYLDYGTGMGNYLYAFTFLYFAIGVLFTWTIILPSVKSHVPKQSALLKLCLMTLITLFIGSVLLYFSISNYILNPFMIMEGRFDQYYWIFGCFLAVVSSFIFLLALCGVIQLFNWLKAHNKALKRN
ncbi:hypothetical protein AB4259_22550 [Vibrio amylolyticus]|uniref:hypothetical protein n=1 Tax=Vibrio amylolyticus TaxID=2847292 RepID=UPI00354F6AA3